MGENIRFAQTFSSLGGIPLLTSLFGCFPVEPFMESEMALLGAMKSPSKALKDEIDQGKPNKCVKGSRSADASTQTELVISQLVRRYLDKIQNDFGYCLEQQIKS